MVLDAARDLTRRGHTEFTRAQLLDEVMGRDPSRLPQSLGPVIQGMTINATGGPPSPCGTPLERVAHGRYRLIAQGSPTRWTASRPTPPQPAPEASHSGEVDIVLVGCTKTKASTASLARTLYQSPLFERRRRYAETRGRTWYVLSAEHGLVHPDSLLEPYDVALAEQSEDYRRAWAHWIVAKLRRVEGSLHGRVIEIHAGEAYARPLLQLLRAAGATASQPTVGMRQGEQLSWYDRHPETPAAEPAAGWLTNMTVAGGPYPVPGFTYRWPDVAEAFASATELTVTVAGANHRVQVAACDREAYGRVRRRIVVFVGSEPVAEAVATDEYPDSRTLLGLLKDADGRMVRPGETVPEAYAGFPLVAFADEVTGPYTPCGLAARLSEDDIVGWAAFALARKTVRTRGLSVPASEPPPARVPAPRSAGPSAIVGALLRYGREHVDERVGEAPQFTPHAEANRLVVEDPFAFLLAVVFDQGIPAERAWRAPYELKLRLGHLEPARMAAGPERVRAAVAQAPALHRYVNNLPGWLVETARTVHEEYAGQASLIWAGRPRAAELATRLRRFPGIGQKKAAMAVEILARDLGVPIADLSGSDIAFDVHVRRVFLRTQLAEYDDLDHIVDVARRLHPERPGELDYPAWLVGRQWCGAGVPDCGACVLREACPRDVNRAAAVRGS
nr:DUF6884 domain-containing protein [Micromonospora sp. RTP1Z1]